jgi:hypothetical protein
VLRQSRGAHRPTEAAPHDQVRAKGQQADLVLLEADLELDAGASSACWISAIAPAICGAANWLASPMRDVLSD